MPNRPKVFISYSRSDAGIAKKICMLALSVGAQPWRDTDCITPGEVWQVSIASAIKDCDRVLVLWCRHSRGSSEVRKEYMSGIKLKKTITPVLIDKIFISGELARFQTIDISSLTWWAHEIARIDRWLILCGAAMTVAGLALDIWL